MKKVLSLVAVTGIVAASSAAFAGSIVNSKHNLSATPATGQSSNFSPGTSTQICVYCHAPHNAKLSLPLWNRTNPTTAFVLYSGVNMQNRSFKSSFTTDSTSLFCMSCHDGNTAMNAVHNAGIIENPNGAPRADLSRPENGTLSPTVLSGPATLGAKTADSLTKTHPINFPVSTTDGQSDLNVGGGVGYENTMGPGVAPGYTFTVRFPLFKIADPTRPATTRSLECGSCHAVHDSTYSPFLRDTMDGSKLCLGCHNK
jgi:predicted CXXCH cytochrome family protein